MSGDDIRNPDELANGEDAAEWTNWVEDSRRGALGPDPAVEERVVRALLSQGLILPGSTAPRRTSWFAGLRWRPVAVAAGVACAFVLGFSAGRQNPSPDRLVRIVQPETDVPASMPSRETRRAPAVPDRERTEDSDPGAAVASRVTLLHRDGTDPFLHYSEADEHPRDLSILVKTWEY